MYYQVPYPPLHSGHYRQQYPPIQTATFTKSVASFQRIAAEASIVLKKLAEPQFAYRLMSAAQLGHQQEVDRLIKSIGTRSPITTQYTPSGVMLTIHAQAQGSPCCTLTMYIKWRD